VKVNLLGFLVMFLRVLFGVDFENFQFEALKVRRRFLETRTSRVQPTSHASGLWPKGRPSRPFEALDPQVWASDETNLGNLYEDSDRL
jgi:hypothetical protein